MPPSAPTPENFPPELALSRLPGSQWQEANAAHLFRRMGFSADKSAVQSALRKPLRQVVLDAFMPGEELPESDKLRAYKDSLPKRRAKIRATSDREEVRKLRRELRQEENECFREFAIQWFRHARDPENSAREKFVLFLQNIFVVERDKIKQAHWLHSLQSTLRRGIQGDYRELCKKISREPAMIRYLDLQQSTMLEPNENFARELFELFILGEGNYTEKDVKEAARAFTGYRIRNGTDFHFNKYKHDDREKTIFGETGKWTGDEVIDLAFEQPAARTYFIRELFKYYLAEETPHEAYVEAFGEQWANYGFKLRNLLEIFFQSRLFFHPTYRGNLIKSPVQFYLGLCQDLKIDVLPFQTNLLRSMASMGQSFYNPPNVRGWLYGRNWINATTVSARRQLVEQLFSPLNDDKLNGEEKEQLEQAEELGQGNFLVTRERLRELPDLEPEALAEHFVTFFITQHSSEQYKQVLEELLADKESDDSLDQLRYALIALLQSPAYNLS
ncbi:MAG: DUF1800 family protein [Opitutales bacterium]